MGRKGYLQFWCLCWDPLGEMMQDARGYQTIKCWYSVTKAESGNTESCEDSFGS